MNLKKGIQFFSLSFLTLMLTLGTFSGLSAQPTVSLQSGYPQYSGGQTTFKWVVSASSGEQQKFLLSIGRGCINASDVVSTSWSGGSQGQTEGSIQYLAANAAPSGYNNSAMKNTGSAIATPKYQFKGLQATYTLILKGSYTTGSGNVISGDDDENTTLSTTVNNVIPVKSVSITSGGSVTFCDGGSVTLTASDAVNSLQWKKDGVSIPGATSATYIATTSGSYTVVSSGNSPCNSATSNAIIVTVNPIPAAPGVTPVTYCQNATASALAATGTNLLWYTASTGGTGSTTAPTPSTATAGSSSFFVSQTSAAGCESPRATLTVTVNVCTPPSNSHDDDDDHEGDHVGDDDHEGGHEGEEHEGNEKDKKDKKEKDSKSNNGKKDLKKESSNKDKHSSLGIFATDDMTSAMNNNNANVVVSSYPNPYTDKITFRLNAKQTGKAKLSLYNFAGQKVANVFEGTVQANSTQTVEYTVPSSQRGNLIFVFQNGTNTTTGKLMNAKK